jgi:hypothetical protein
MFSNSQTQDRQFPLSSKSGSGLQLAEPIYEQLDPESYGGGVTPDTQQLAPTPLV